MTKERNINLDLIRCVAVFFVISVHFFLNSGFYELPCSGGRMLIMCIARTFFITCVPLFLMLTGYLMNKKEWSIGYYKGLKKTYCIYIMISICCLIFRIFFQKEKFGIRQMLISILDFSADSYSWYIEMYIGLFLLIPFLNILWTNLKIREKKIFIYSLLFLTALPSLLNCWNLIGESHLVSVNQIAPDYWEILYPFTYYYLGAYISELSSEKFFWKRESLLLVALAVLFGGVTYYRSGGGVYEWTSYNSYQGGEVVIISVLIFRILCVLPIDKCPVIIKKIISRISILSLGIYLASFISDSILYGYLAQKVIDPVKRMDYFPVMVISSFFISFGISWIINMLYHGMECNIKKLKNRIKNKVIKS